MKKTSFETWLNELQVGDDVVLPWGGIGINIKYKIFKIEKVWKRFVFVNGRKYRKSDGYPVGGYNLGRERIQRPTKRIIAEIEKSEAIEYIKSFDLKTLDISTLSQIREILEGVGRAGK